MKPWRLVGQGAAAMAGGMGIGRFAYTPILPIMHNQAGLTPQLGAALATANYTGYLAGALAAIVAPRLTHSRWAVRVSLLLLSATLALMPLSHNGTFWLTLRLIAGVTSALVFVIAVSAALPRLHGHHVAARGDQARHRRADGITRLGNCDVAVNIAGDRRPYLGLIADGLPMLSRQGFQHLV